MRKRSITIAMVFVMAFTVFAVTPDESSAATKYWIKVNTKANVVNVYRKTGGKWKPVKAMLCSCGVRGHRTPTGTFSIKKKWRWQRLFYGVSGQYISQFKGNYLFHSVVYGRYKSPSKCIRKEYNKLGKNASHGCVRLATMDAKWIYRECGRGTKVTIYKSSDPGPLGKPKKVAMAGSGKYGWDPTYDSKNNKKFRLTGPVITIDKADTVENGSTFKIKKGVTAKSPYTYEDLTPKIKVVSVTFRPEGEEAFAAVSDKTVDTTKAGTYRVVYSCSDTYCGRKAVRATCELTVLPAEQEETDGNTDPSENTDPPAVNTDPLSGTIDLEGTVEGTGPTGQSATGGQSPGE